MVARGKDGDEIVRGWDGHVHTAIVKIDNQQGPTVLVQGILLNVVWQPGWKGRLKENGYVNIYG